MIFEINTINAITAEEAKEMVRQHDEHELQKDINDILQCINKLSWGKIKDGAQHGNTVATITIGYDNRNTCNIRMKYGWYWLCEEGEKIINKLFSSMGYTVTFEWKLKFVRINISWAD